MPSLVVVYVACLYIILSSSFPSFPRCISALLTQPLALSSCPMSPCPWLVLPCLYPVILLSTPCLLTPAIPASLPSSPTPCNLPPIFYLLCFPDSHALSLLTPPPPLRAYRTTEKFFETMVFYRRIEHEYSTCVLQGNQIEGTAKLLSKTAEILSLRWGIYSIRQPYQEFFFGGGGW